MNNLKIFLGTYWRHAKSILDLLLFVVSLALLFFNKQITLSVWAGIFVMFVVALIAAYRTWLYQYKQTQQLIKLEEKEVEYDDLNDVQQSILIGMNKEPGKQITSTSRLGGVIFMGVGDVGDKYDGNEIGAEIVELEKIDILRVDGHSTKSGRPIYKPTSHGFKILKQLKEHGTK